MPRRILVVPTNHGAGVTSVCLGLARALEQGRTSVGYVKPFAQPRRVGEDHSVELVRLATTLRPPQPVPVSRLEEALAAGRLSSLMEDVVDLVEDVFTSSSVVVIEGLAADDEQLYAGMVNAEVARALDAEVVLVGSAARTGPERVGDQMSAAERHYRVQSVSRVIGAVVNRIGPEDSSEAYAEALTRRGFTPVALVPRRSEFTRPRVADVARQLGLEIIHEGEVDRRVADVAIAAQALPGLLSYLVPDRLILVPADRHEIMLAVALAEMSGTRLAGLVLTAGVRPDHEVLTMCGPALMAGLPVLFSEHPTFETASLIKDLDPEIAVDDESRVNLVAEDMAAQFSGDWIAPLRAPNRVRRSTPPAFRRAVINGARGQLATIALTDATNPMTLRVAMEMAEWGMCRPVLVGDDAVVSAALDHLGIDLPPGVRVVDSSGARALVLEEREDIPTAARPGAEALVLGLSMLADGEVEGVVGGLGLRRETVAELATSIVGLRPEAETLSSVHYLMTPDEAFAYTDCVFNEAPTASELAAIARCCADDCQSVGITARVAFVEPHDPDEADDARGLLAEATTLLRQNRPDLHVVGPLSLAQASRREPDVEGAGNGSVFVFPGSRHGGAAYRAAMRWPGTSAIGPIMQGLRRPVNVAPRGGSPADLRNVIVATAVQAGTAM